MTVIELLFCLFAATGAVMGALFAFHVDAGPLFTVLQIWLFGQTLAFFGTLAVVILLDYFESLRTGRPEWPACRCGATKKTFDRALEQSIASCSCGASYVRHGLECRELLPGGASRPYLRWLPFRRWIDARTDDRAPELAPYRGSEPPR